MKRFFQNHFSISSTKRSRITGGVIAGVLLVLVLICAGGYVNNPTLPRILLFAGCLIAPVLVGAVFAFRIQCKDTVLAGCIQAVVFFLAPFATITMCEALNGVFVYDMTYTGFGRTYVLVMLLQLLVYAVSGSFKVTFLVLNPLAFVMGLVHHFLMIFRGTPFVPADFYSIGVADTILEQYSYALDYQIVSALIILVLLVGIGIRIGTPKPKLAVRAVIRVISGLLTVAVMLTFFFTSFFADMGVKPDFWNQNRGYRNYGFLYSFFINIKYLYVLEPAGYDPSQIEQYVSDVVADAPLGDTAETKPDIICIMNESLSDLSVLGDFATNKEVMPFLSSLTENTVRGNLYVPVIGAGTSNTEFEFLTGHSTAFLPSGSNAYMLYVKESIPTLAILLRQQGYSVTSMHPYNAGGWQRDRVYPLLGMDIFYSIEDMLDMSIFRQYQKNGYDIDYLDRLMKEAYAGEEILMRQYVSDQYNYRWIIDDYENRDRSKPYFMFNVTMQNHGGYRKDASNFPQNVWLTETDAFPETNRFLSLMEHSDRAFEQLVTYFKTVDRPVLICMFGDHQPAIEEEFVEWVLGDSLNTLSLSEQQSRHVTPFYIWANFDIEEQQIEALSSNYLSSLLLQTAGLQMSDYNRYLLELSKTLPVVDTVGYRDSQGYGYSWNGNTPYADVLKRYEYIQYNAVLDKSERKETLFTLSQ